MENHSHLDIGQGFRLTLDSWFCSQCELNPQRERTFQNRFKMLKPEKWQIQNSPLKVLVAWETKGWMKRHIATWQTFQRKQRWPPGRWWSPRWTSPGRSSDPSWLFCSLLARWQVATDLAFEVTTDLSLGKSMEWEDSASAYFIREDTKTVENRPLLTGRLYWFQTRWSDIIVQFGGGWSSDKSQEIITIIIYYGNNNLTEPG